MPATMTAPQHPGTGSPEPPPLVSVVVIFLNAADAYFPVALQSVLDQTMTDWELLLVDDGSTDGSTDMARALAARLPGKVRCLEHEGHVNRGKAHSRNLGIRAARGRYIAFLDADDVWLPGKLAAETAILEANPDVDLLFSRTIYHHQVTGFRHPQLIDLPHGRLPPGLWFVRMVQSFDNIACPTATVARRGVFDRVGGFEEGFVPSLRITDDMVMWFKVALRLVAFYNAEPTAIYRIHPTSSCGGDPQDRQNAETFASYRWLRRHVRAHAPDRRMARMLTRAVVLRAAELMLERGVDDAGHWYGPRAPERVLFDAVRGLPTAARRRAGRLLLRAGVRACVAAVAERTAPEARPLPGGLRVGPTIVATPAGAGAALAQAGPFDAWCFIGRTLGTGEALRAGPLAGLPEIAVAARLAAVAAPLAPAYVAALHDVVFDRPGPGRLAAPLFDLHPDATALFLQAAQARTVLDLIRSEADRRVLVVVEDGGVYERVSAALGGPALDPGSGTDQDALWAVAWRRHRRWIRDRTAAWTRSGAGRSLPDLDVLLTVYVDRGSLAEDGRTNRYFGSLPGWLRDAGRRVGWLLFPWQRTIGADELAALKDRLGHALSVDELLAPGDAALLALAKVNGLRRLLSKPLAVAGLDFTGPFRRELRANLLDPANTDGLAFALVGRRLARRGTRIDRVLYPFENLGWEKLLCASLRRHRPDTAVIGYQHSTFAEFLLNYRSDPRLWSTAYTPHAVVTASPHFARRLVALGAPAERVTAGTSLRYDHLFAVPPAPPPDGGKAAVLALFPIGRDETMELLSAVLAAFGPRPDRRVLLKFHPTCDWAGGLDAKLPAHIRRVEGPLSALLAGVGAAVCISGSTVPEMLARGLPVIVKRPAVTLPTVDLPEDGSLPGLYLASDAADLARRADAILTAPPGTFDPVVLARAALALFAPPGPTDVALFLSPGPVSIRSSEALAQ